MNWNLRIGFIASAALAAASQPAFPQAISRDGDDWLYDRLAYVASARPLAGRAVAEIRSRMAVSLEWTFPISARDREIATLADAASQASRDLVRLVAYDLDGDGRITTSEILASRYWENRTLAGFSGRPGRRPPPVEAADLNRDCVVTVAEAWQWARRNIGKWRADPLPPMSLDADGDGLITQAEYQAAVDRLLARLDLDGDGAVSEAEVKAWQAEGNARFARRSEADRIEHARLAFEASQYPLGLSENRPQADLPGHAAGARLLHVRAGGNSSLSTVSIGSDDVVVGVSALDVEPGAEPLVIVATSRLPTIWKITGTVERVRLFVAKLEVEDDAETPPHVGVVGVPRERVIIPRQQGCAADGISRGGPITSDDLSVLLDRQPERTLYQWNVVTGVPSGVGRTSAALSTSRASPAPGDAAVLWREATKAWPAGVVEVAADQVVAELPVQAYQVLPQNAGLAQLVAEGALTVSGYQRVRHFSGGPSVYGEITFIGGSPGEEYMLPSAFRINRKIRFPADVKNSAARRFVRGSNIPAPEGDGGEWIMLQEDAGSPPAEK